MKKICARCGCEFHAYNTIVKYCPKCSAEILREKRAADRANKPPVKQSWNGWGKTREKGKSSLEGLKSGKRRKSELSKAKDAAWIWVSRYVRLKYSLDNGACKCYTCGAWKYIKNCDAGHFISRSVVATRYHEDNIRVQCIRCNRFCQGESFKFEQHLIEEIGQERVDELKRIAKTIGDDSISYHRAIEKEYKQKVIDLQNEMGVKYW